MSDRELNLSDEELLTQLFDLLNARAPPEDDLQESARAIRRLPPGLRAMAATNCLDISMTLDDMGWHFFNFGEPAWVEETLQGLRELGLSEIANWFEEARDLMRTFPETASIDDYYEFARTGRGARLDQIATLYWERQRTTPSLVQGSLIYDAWVRYARLYPAKVFELN